MSQTLQTQKVSSSDGATQKTIVFVVRDPDAYTDIQTFGPPVQVVDIDMGSSFDRAKIHPPRPGQPYDPDVLEWIVSHAEDADELPEGDARDYYVGVIESIASEIGIDSIEQARAIREKAVNPTSTIEADATSPASEA